ncbi:hypothetical protein [Burkholderia vietnamiensis]|nr:hypothetical protein [Burkholderia vietnamiensis]
MVILKIWISAIVVLAAVLSIQAARQERGIRVDTRTVAHRT